MLVLTRREGESVVIGDQVEVTILEMRGTQVRIGITAPRDVTILRKELYTTILAANQQAVSTKQEGLDKLISAITAGNTSDRGAVGLKNQESEEKKS